MSMTSADLRSLLTLVYKLVFLSVGLYMVLSGRLGVGDRWFLTEKCE